MSYLNPLYMPSPRTNKKSAYWAIIMLLVLIVFLALGNRYKDILKPNAEVVVPLNSSCDLRAGGCTSELPGGGKVSFSISPTDIPLLRPLVLMVKTEGVKALFVDVDFVGIGMDMGFNRSRLKLDQSTQGESKSQFTGKGTLPVCVRSKMDWEARVLLKTNQGLIMVPFRFYTNK